MKDRDVFKEVTVTTAQTRSWSPYKGMGNKHLSSHLLEFLRSHGDFKGKKKEQYEKT